MNVAVIYVLEGIAPPPPDDIVPSAFKTILLDDALGLLNAPTFNTLIMLYSIQIQKELLL